ncbi:Glucan 1,6-alpha-glucosidase [Candidatus Izimaplasma bacterium HR1]|jgi:glycosidase|uniref:alpha-glucosidase n=1 Tax=Candidatus Izimoplasma sp. HR1 TaxID=1541959 RepID=UPI0004F84F0D|nr:Glucan 1,6-alpha-glucosidase [Candidatus Izimaplasma bacterium HR1]
MIKKDWHKDIIYQIYPKSFLDTSGNGYGDINGIIQKLDYFTDLGVNCLWLSPVFESPMKDNGYDVSDYLKIDSRFGTNKDMYKLIDEAKSKGIKIMLDLVVNHTSDQHKWFQEALKGKANKYRDYYIWRDDKNEIESIFLGDAWEYDELSKQYYFHLFAKEQPDLNWENIDMRNDIYNMMNFWIDKGVSGFRMDVIEFLGKQPDQLITADGPNLHNYIYEMNRSTFGIRDCITVGESWSATNETAKLYTDPSRNELSMIFRFDHITTFWDEKLGKWNPRKFDLVKFKEILFDRQQKEKQKYWNTLFWGNHDLPRSSSYYIKDEYLDIGSKMMFGITSFMSGTPFIFQGEEIGMSNLPLSPEEYKDIEAVNALSMLQEEGYDKSLAIEMVNKISRDNSRTPMQWANVKNAGFSKVEPWTKINNKFAEINVSNQENKQESVLNFYKQIIKLRKEYIDLILYGDFEPLYINDKELFAYKRHDDENEIKIFANFSPDVKKISFDINQDDIIINNYKTNFFSYKLQPYQIIIVKEKT